MFQERKVKKTYVALVAGWVQVSTDTWDVWQCGG
jgi:23S rRNA-/tRNA-specific pseudouridylate synthase